MATIQAQKLTKRQKGLAACACLMAQGDMERLEPAVKMAFDNGVTINELKEAFSQLYAYTGFPRSLNALGILNKVLENKQASWQEGKPWTRPEVWNTAGDNATPLINRIESLHGTHTVAYAEQIGLGSQAYTLIDIQTSGIDGMPLGNTQLYNVYDLNGVKLLDHASSLDSLQPGVYVVNGKKRVIE